MLIEEVATQGSTPQRAGAIRLIWADFHEDREAAVALFLRLVHDHPEVLHSHFTHEFIVCNSHRSLPQFEPMLSALLAEANSRDNSKPGANQRHKGLGFRVGLLFGRIHLSLLDSPSPHTEAARAWVLEARSGSASVRAGLAYVYAENAGVSALTKICLENLQVFLNDDSVHIRETVVRVFTQLGKRHLRESASFFEAFAESKAWRDGMRQFSSYLHKYGSAQADWSLSIVEKLLDNVHPMREDRRTDPEITPLIRLVLHIYEKSSSATVSKRTMHLFGRLMQQNPHYAGVVLQEWDER